jgi:hypothetical protein
LLHRWITRAAADQQNSDYGEEMAVASRIARIADDQRSGVISVADGHARIKRLNAELKARSAHRGDYGVVCGKTDDAMLVVIATTARDSRTMPPGVNHGITPSPTIEGAPISPLGSSSSTAAAIAATTSSTNNNNNNNASSSTSVTSGSALLRAASTRHIPNL